MAKLTTRSAKAKGRRAQDEICRDLLEHIYLPHGCESDDCKPVTMGLSGRDIILTPAARRVLDLVMEVKNVEKLNVGTTFLDHLEKYENEAGLKVLTHRRNHKPMLATLLWSDFLKIMTEVVSARRS